MQNATISLTLNQVIFCCINVFKWNKWLHIMGCYFPWYIHVRVSVTLEGYDIKNKKGEREVKLAA